MLSVFRKTPMAIQSERLVFGVHTEGILQVDRYGQARSKTNIRTRFCGEQTEIEAAFFPRAGAARPLYRQRLRHHDSEEYHNEITDLCFYEDLFIDS